MSKASKSLHRPTDSIEMHDAIEWFYEWGYPFTRPTDYQLKIGPFNFYPSTGTIHRDGDRQPHPDRGLAALKKLLPMPTFVLTDDGVLRPKYRD